MYTINGVSLYNDTYNWKMLRRSQVLTGVNKRLTSVEIPARNGVLPGVPAFKAAPTSIISVKTPGVNLDPLYALFEQNGGVGWMWLDDDPSRRIMFELASIEPEGLDAYDETVIVTIALRFPTAEWRDTDLTTVVPAPVAVPVAEFNIFPGISADITDADIFIGGDFGDFSLEDEASGSWLRTTLTWPNEVGTGLLFVGATGQAFRADVANPWVPLEDVSEYVNYSGAGGFRITPLLIASNPSDRHAKLELTTTSQTDLVFGYRARNAYALRNGGI